MFFNLCHRANFLAKSPDNVKGVDFWISLVKRLNPNSLGSLSSISNKWTSLPSFINVSQNFKEKDFAITDLSHSRAIIKIEGHEVKEVLKKGCPFNFNTLEKNNSINSVYNEIAFTVDMLDDKPDKVRLFALRSFGESLYHSITDSCLEFGYKAL